VNRPEHVIIVGGGLAGARAAQELRAQGHAGRLTVIGAEPELPYDRPPLSKGVLAGVAADDTTLEVAWDQLEVTLTLGRRATGLRPGGLETDRGELGFDALVLATGAQPRRLPDLPADTALVLRTVDDARRLRRELRPGARVVVVGAGWIGAEVATAAAAARCRTTVLEAGPAPLAGALGEQVGALTAPWYAAAGVELRLRAAVIGVEPGAVLLADGSAVPADVVVLGLGARPDTGWLAGSGLALDAALGGAVAVDEHLAASWPRVVAAGDCSAWWSRRFGARLRVEHWDDALHAPAVAVSTLLGRPAVHDPVPWFWSEQFGHVLQHCGYAAGADTVVPRGDPTGPAGWSVCWLAQGRLVAVLAVDRPRDAVQGRRLIAAGATPQVARLADPAVALREV